VNDREDLFREACDVAVEAGGFRMAMIVIVDQSTMLPVSIISAGKDEELLQSIKNVMSSSEGMQTTLVARAMREKKSRDIERHEKRYQTIIRQAIRISRGKLDDSVAVDSFG
jgi:Na+-translocating ferredoxin:NAD+ oxidoreductase RnfA subunit